MLVANTYENGATRSVAFVDANGRLTTTGVVDQGTHDFSPAQHVEHITPTSGNLYINGRLIPRWQKYESVVGGPLVIESRLEAVAYLCEYPFRKPPEIFMANVGVLPLPLDVRTAMLAKLGGKNLEDLLAMTAEELFSAIGDRSIYEPLTLCLGEFGMSLGMTPVEKFLWTPPKK